MDPNPETTAAIERIDRELAKTFQGIARLNDDIGTGRIRCMVCGQPGIHTHSETRHA